MLQPEILSNLTPIVAAVAAVEQASVTSQMSFSEDLGIDSLMMAEVIVMAEDRFGVLIEDDAWSRFKTVDDAVRSIEERMSI